MEVKTLLRLIKDDISHLEGITSEFNMETLPSSDEIEVALVRANALLKELDLLHKLADQYKSGFLVHGSAKEQKVIVIAPDHSNREVFELPKKETPDDEQVEIFKRGRPDPSSAEEQKYTGSMISEQSPAEELSAVINNASLKEAHFTALVEPADTSMLNPFVKESADPIVFSDPGETGHELLDSDSEVVIDQGVPIIEAVAGAEDEIVAYIPDQKEPILAEEFSEVKKTLNETLGESHQMVNDILTSEKSESEYKIIPIDSIWDGIGLNDRFLFVRELFANNSAKFESTVEALDQLASIHEAVNFLKNNFKWNKTSTSQKFLVLVKRRFTK